MKRILIANIKGGCGKTMLANELAYSLDRTGTPYTYLDMDGQRGGGHTDAQRDDAAVVIADTPGAIETADLADLARSADVIVIPTLHTALDVYSFAETLGAVRGANPGARIIVVHNRHNRYRLARDFDEWLADNADGAEILQLPQSEPIQAAATHGMSVQDYNRRSRGAQAMREVIASIRDAAGLGKEV